MALNFAENKTYPIARLHYIGADGNPVTADNVAVRFTSGWVSIESEDGGARVLPRDRVIVAEGVEQKPGRVMVL